MRRRRRGAAASSRAGAAFSVFDVIEGGPFAANHREMRDLELVRLAAAALQRTGETVAHVVVDHADVGAEVELLCCVERRTVRRVRRWLTGGSSD